MAYEKRTRPKKRHPVVDQLRAIRQEKKIFQADLGATMGWSHNSISDWECGYRTPSLKALTDWCDALGVKLTIQ